MSDLLDDLAALMNPSVPENISRIIPGAEVVPTTDEMDGLFTQEDKANKYKVMAQCQSCNAWTELEQRGPPIPCSGCGAKRYDPTSYTSLRSFNPDRKRVARGYKKK